MRLPNPERAVVDIEKLRDYCLSKSHLRGRHKARVFEAVLGLTASHVDLLRGALLEATMTYEAIPSGADVYGERYMLDFPFNGPVGKAIVCSRWIVRTGENFPRLTACYVR